MIRVLAYASDLSHRDEVSRISKNYIWHTKFGSSSTLLAFFTHGSTRNLNLEIKHLLGIVDAPWISHV